MVLSMTGFGQARGSYQNKNILVEIRSLNGKSTDLRIKVPVYFKEKEMELRRVILDGVKRGKIDANLTIISELGDENYALNKTLFKRYHQDLTQMVDELKITQGDLLQSILRIPNVIQANEAELTDEEWAVVLKLTEEAIANIQEFRQKEGESLYADFNDRINAISDHLTAIEPHEQERINVLKERMQKNLAEYLGKENVDKNRYEQEVLFYMEKLDINEEKVRLRQHCKYFLEELNSTENGIVKGKKLAFISQEIGREINTMGAKAQHSAIQQKVVSMKDELEKIKEQVANTL